MKVLKFGGSSVGQPERILKVLSLVTPRIQAGEKIALVFSAYEGVTNELISISELARDSDSSYTDRFKKLSQRHAECLRALLPSHEQSRVTVQLTLWLNELDDSLRGVTLLKELSLRARDAILSFGERLSSYTIAQALSSRGIAADFLDARSIIRTDDGFGNARVDMPETARLIRSHFETHRNLQVITGFIGSTAKGDTTTLGRGGSDYTAAIVGAALDCEEVEIWTDVDGMMTADPRKVPKAFSIPQVTYQEALELCHFGAKVIYTPTLQPAMEKKIPIRILNTFNPEFPGTVITHSRAPSDAAVTGVTSIDEIGLLRVQGSGLMGIAGIASRLFGALARGKVNVILITQASSEHSICAAVSPGDSARAMQLISEEFALEIDAGLVERPVVEEELSIISIVGENMRHSPGTSGRLFGILGKNGVNVVAIAQGSSELNISFVTSRRDEVKALIAAHEAFFLSEQRSLNLFLAGTGLIAKTLLEQIKSHAQTLRERYLLEIKLVGVANSSEFAISRKGLSLQDPLAKGAETHGKSTNFAETIISMNLPNSVFVDCTASETVASQYITFLRSSIPVVTPNKKALSASSADYQKLKAASRKRNTTFLFETCVGAGLPVISTLGDLIRSGDVVHKIEAVLSGTLSYLFNTFCAPGNTPLRFSEIIKDAKARGYTEPDPRDDLNGVDAARKLLILARESGATLELADIRIERFLPDQLFQAKDVDEFLKALPEVDPILEKRRTEALKKGCRLCYMALLEGNQASLTLCEIDASHPFFGLSGSDNIIAFSTQRYSERPLVVKGPGAGASVTAAGVFADIIRLA